MRRLNSKLLARIFFYSVPFLFVFATVIGYGFSEWIFVTETEPTSVAVDYEGDPIRENAVFGGDYDYALTGSRTYDVYFMSQMCDIETHILEEDGTLNAIQINNDGDKLAATTVQNYKIKQAPVPYSSQKIYSGVAAANLENLEEYGCWTDANGDPLTTDITQNQNRYFIRYQSVTELTPDQVEQLGSPSFSLFDRITWPLSFMCWTPCYDLPVYKIEGNAAVFPNPTNRVATNYGTFFPGRVARKMQGYAPYSNVFTSLYAGTLLEYYERLSYEDPANADDGIKYTNVQGVEKTFHYVWYVNNRPSIFFFPVFTSDGKNYTKTDDTQVKDTFALTNIYNSRSNESTDLFNYDGVFSDAINNAFLANNSSYFTQRGNTVTYECYRLSRRLFNDTSLDYMVVTDPDPKNNNAWYGNKYKVLDMIPALITGDYINLYLVVKKDTGTTTRTQYKTQTWINGTRATIIDESEYSIIDQALASEGLMKYYSRGQHETLAMADTTYLGTYESRDYYMVYERFYTPKLIGGPTENISYQNNENIFVKEGIGNETHNWVLRNVDLSSTEKFSYTTQETDSAGVVHDVTITLPKSYFGVLVSDLDVQLNQRINYSLQIMPDDPNGTPTPPIFESSTTTAGAVTYFQSDDLFIDIFDPTNPDYTDVNTISVSVDNGTPVNLATAVGYGYNLGGDFNLIKVREPGNYTLMFQVEYIESTKYYVQDTAGDYSEIVYYDYYGNVVEYVSGGTFYDANGNRLTTAPTLTVTRELPHILDAWGYRFSDVFLNICDVSDGATLPLGNQGNTLRYQQTTGRDRYVDTSSYTAHSMIYLYGSTLSLDDIFYVTYQDASGSTVTNTVGTFETIFNAIDTYNASNTKKKELVDLVTGQIFTRENITSFEVVKYYVFVIKFVGENITYGNA